jgi:hypothetical protein
MSHFYGTLQGLAGKATRRGSKRSGLVVEAASWRGAVRVELFAEDGADMCRVELVPWHNNGTRRVLYVGPVSGLAREVAA